MAITSNSVQNNQNRSGNLNTNAARRTYRAGGGTITVREGETLKGVVSDIHGNEITISMDDGSSFTGKLPEASQYSIGQKAAFLITSLEGGTIYMKAVSQAYLLGMEDTIEQALEEAGLPKSPRNLEIVRCLLQNQQSISRENIADSLQLCAKFPDADVNTVISMKRLGMPMDSMTVTQMDHYQNQTHQLLYQMDSLADSINDLLLGLVKENPSIARYAAGEALNIALNSAPSLEEFTLAANQMAEQAAEQAEQQAPPEGTPENVIPTEAEGSEEAAQTDSTNAEKAPGTNDTTSAQTDAASSPLARMKQLFTNIADRTFSENTETPAKSTQWIPEQTGHILSPEERSQLAKQLEPFTANKELLSSLRDGTLTAREFLTTLKTVLPSIPDENLKELFSSREMQQVLKGQFMSGWTLSPEELKEEGSVERLYGKMQEQFTELTNLSRMFATRSPGETIIHTTSDMQQNMEFMKMLNEQFAYMQLPIKLSEENAHGDLYVMTRKDTLKKSKDNLKVLLHLEMDSLGTLDIHITKDHTNISTRFFVAKESARKLLEKNAELLKDAINEQGYSFTSEFVPKEKDVDVLHDFIEQDTPAPVGNITRYNFDLRA